MSRTPSSAKRLRSRLPSICSRPTPSRGGFKPSQGVHFVGSLAEALGFCALSLFPRLKERCAYRLFDFRLRPARRAGFICSQRAITLPSGSAPMKDHPCPGTSCFPTTSVPPAFLKVSIIYIESRGNHKGLTISLTRRALQLLFEKGFQIVAASADQIEMPPLIWS